MGESAKEIAERLRKGIPPEPTRIFHRDIKPAGKEGVKVISSFERAQP